jgi:hypothetical protein
MARFKVFRVFVLLTLLGLAASSKLIYRKYEKKHPKRNYVQIVEIFETRQEPPGFSESDKELNDFLARDAYKTDMNCTKGEGTEATTETIKTTTEKVTLPTIPTTAYRRSTTPTTFRTPNLNELFTISTRSTKPTIKPNPRENTNPDYTNVTPWQSHTHSVQVTKHLPNANTPTIVIIAPDDQPKRNRTVVKDFDKDLSRAVTMPTTSREFENDPEIVYMTSEEKLEDGDYDGEKFDHDFVEEGEDGSNRDIDAASQEHNDYDDYEGTDGNDEDYDQERRRRRRHKKETAKKPKYINKHKSKVSKQTHS